jgi:hypothetical protein
MTILLRLITIIGLLSTTTLSISGARVAGTPLVLETLELASAVREITVTARRYAFTPARIEVNQGDIGENHPNCGGCPSQLHHRRIPHLKACVAGAERHVRILRRQAWQICLLL